MCQDCAFLFDGPGILFLYAFRCRGGPGRGTYNESEVAKIWGRLIPMKKAD